MSSVRRPILRKVLLFIFVAILIFLYGLQYASIKILRYFKNTTSIKALEEASKHGEVYEKDFQVQWCNAKKEIGNWRAMIHPCEGWLTWESRKSLSEGLETDAKRSFIANMDVRPAGEFSRINIVTKSKMGLTKNFGGDSWRVKINGTSSISSKVIDLANGAYDVLFLIADQGVYFVHIYLDYTLCNGFRDPPVDWFRKGNAQGKYQGVNVIGTPKDLLLHPLMGTPFRIDVPKRRLMTNDAAPNCNHTCKLLWDGTGRWRDSKWISYFKADNLKQKQRIKRRTNKRGHLLVYGDSVSVFFAQSLTSRRSVCGGVFKSCRFIYNWIYQVKNSSIARTLRDNYDFNVQRILGEFKSTVNDSSFNSERSIVIVNFGLHFVESTNFSNYQRLVEDFAKVVTERDNKGERKIKGKVIWKTTTAINKERADHPHLHWRRFLTNYRILLYNAYAVDIMCKYGISVVDAYSISESYPYGTGTHAGRSHSKNDIVHYNNEAFYPIEEFIEEYF